MPPSKPNLLLSELLMSAAATAAPLPAPYPRQLFTQPSTTPFDPQAFLAALPEDAQPVQAAKLSATVQDLTAELLQLIDRDHQIFLELTGDLSRCVRARGACAVDAAIRVDATVSALRAPLHHLQEKIVFYKKCAASPLDAVREYDERLQELQSKQRALQDRLRAHALREGVARDVSKSAHHLATQRLALLSRVEPPQAGDEALKRSIENHLVEKLGSAESQRALAVLGSVDHARRALAGLCAHQGGAAGGAAADCGAGQVWRASWRARRPCWRRPSRRVCRGCLTSARRRCGPRRARRRGRWPRSGTRARSTPPGCCCRPCRSATALRDR
jgi:hypothetical protein